MKTLLLLLTASFCYAQTIPKGAERIELVTNVSDSTLFATVKQFILNEQFSIRNQAAANFSFATNYKSVSDMDIRLFVTVLNHKVLIHGQGRAVGATTESEPLFYDEPDSSLSKRGFIEMNQLVIKLAVPIAGSTIDYPRNPLNPSKGD